MLVSSLYARRARLALGLMAVALGVTVSTALATLALQVGDDLARTLRAAGPNFVILPAGANLPLDLGGAELEPARAGLSLPESAVAELRHCFWKNNLLAAAPELSVAAAVDHAPVTLIGTWFEHDVPGEESAWRTGLGRLRPHWKLEGRWPSEDTNEMVVGRDLAARLGLRPGQRASVTVEGREEQWLVTGTLAPDQGVEDAAWAPLSSVQRLAARTGELDRVWLSALVKPTPKRPLPDPRRDPAGYERYMCTAYPGNLARDLAGRIPLAEVLPMTAVVAGEGMVVQRLDLLMLLLALASLTASILGLFSTATATVVERSVELGLLRALGATSRQIAALFLGEAVVISLAGGFLGCGLGVIAAAAIRGQTFGTSAPLPPLLLPLALVLSLTIALLGTWGPMRVALRLDPAGVLRG
jgi:putative ABC transport system permease protein